MFYVHGCPTWSVSARSSVGGGAAGDETKRNDELIHMRAGEGNEDEREEMPEVVIEAASPPH